MSASSRLPKYRRHSTSGQAYVERLGRRYYLGKFNTPTSRQRYAQFLNDIEQQRAADAPKFTPANAPRDLLISELTVAYIEHARSYYVKDGQTSSELTCIKCALRPLIELHGALEAASFSPLRLKEVRQRMIESGLALKTINGSISRIRRMFSWGVEEELLPPSVAHGLREVKGLKPGRTSARATKPVPPVADDIINSTLPHLPPVVRDMVQFQRLTGCRPGEVCKLRPRDIDRSGDVWAYRPASHKTEHHGRDRVVFIGPRAQGILARYLFRDASHYCFSPAESEEKRAADRRLERQSKPTRPQLQRNDRNSRARLRMLQTGHHCYKPTAYNRAIRRGVDKANLQRIAAHEQQRLLFDADADGEAPKLLPRWHANQLRHSAGTELRRRFGLEVARVVLGHSEVETTQVYAERDMIAAAAAMQQIG